MNKKYLYALILLLTIGFATVSTVLYLNGNVTVGVNEEDFDIYFSEAILDNEDVSKDVISTNGKRIDYITNDLNEIGKESILEYEVTNNSSQYNAKVEITCTPLTTEYFVVTVEGTGNIPAKTKKTGNIKVKQIKSIVENKDVKFSCDLNAEALEKTEVGKDVNSEDESSTYSIYGFLVDDNNEILKNKTLVVYSEKPKYTKTDDRGYFYVDGLEPGTHEVYYVGENTKEELLGKTKEDIKEVAITNIDVTTSSKNLIFGNGYSVDKVIIEKTNNRKYNVEINGENRVLIQNKPYGSMVMTEKEGYTFDGWYVGDYKFKDTDLVIDGTNPVAKFTPNKYEIIFETNGGSVVENVDIEYDAEYGELPTSNLEGYTLDGWYTNGNYDVKIAPTSVFKLKENQTVYAKWTPNEYNVNFVENGGSSVEGITVTYDSKYKNLPTSIKEGYSLEWCLDAELSTCINNDTIVKTASNHTLYAKWTANEYDLIYDLQGGTLTETGKNLTYDEAYGELPEPTKTGYRFIGWFTGISDGEEITEATIVKVTSSQTIYARWEANTYTVTFDSNGGENVSTVLTVTYDETYGSLPSANRTGYTFEGWYLGETKIEDTTTFKEIINVELVAKWEANEYTVRVSSSNDNVLINDANGTTPQDILVKFDNTATFTVAPNIGYYLASITCSEGYSVSGFNTGIPSIEEQTVTITNNSSAGNGTCQVTTAQITAAMIPYNNEKTGMDCDNVQCALDVISDILK